MLRFLSFLGAILWSGLAQSVVYGAPPFAAVVHRTNPVHTLRLADLKALFLGNAKRWPTGEKVILVERDASGEASQFLLQRLLNTTPREYQRRLANIEFKGEEPVKLKILNSDAGACKFVFNVPSAIALVEASSLSLPECREVQVVRIDGKLPGEEGYRLQ